MHSLRAMRALLKGTGLYALSGDTVVDAELCAYALALELLRERVETLLREAFVVTAQDKGLRVWETLMGEPDRSALPVQQRRDMIVYRLSVMPWDFNKSGLEAALRSVGLAGSIEEETQAGANTIRVVEHEYTGLRQTHSMIASDCRKLLPAHLECIFDIGSFTFDMFDGKDYTCDEWDEIDATWDRIEAAGPQL